MNLIDKTIKKIIFIIECKISYNQYKWGKFSEIKNIDLYIKKLKNEIR
jgi:hypothetical protein